MQHKLRLLITAISLAVVGIWGAVSLVGGSSAGGANAPASNGRPVPLDNPAAHQPGFPGGAGNKPYPRDPESIGPCGEKWKDVYTNEDGNIEIVEGTDEDGHSTCHVLTQDESVQLRQKRASEPDAAPGRVAEVKP